MTAIPPRSRGPDKVRLRCEVPIPALVLGRFVQQQKVLLSFETLNGDRSDLRRLTHRSRNTYQVKGQCSYIAVIGLAFNSYAIILAREEIG